MMHVCKERKPDCAEAEIRQRAQLLKTVRFGSMHQNEKS